MNYKDEHEYRSETVENVETTSLVDFINNPKFVKYIIIFAIVAGLIYLISKLPQKEPELLPARKLKRDRAITRVIKRKHKKENCEQYILNTTHTGWYPLLHRTIVIAIDSIWLKKGEVWKYGITCNSELERYPNSIYYYDGKNKLTNIDLTYIVQFYGTEKECKIEEKIKIYNYPLLPECVQRKRKIIRPPGHKNDN